MPDHDDIGTPAWEAALLRRQAELAADGCDPDEAEALRRRADELDPPTEPAPTGVNVPMPEGGGHLHITPGLLADIAESHDITREEAAEKIAGALRVEGPALAAGWRDVTLPPPTRDQHLDDEARASIDLMGEGTLAAFVNHGTVFAVLRDIADAEPLHRQDGTEGPTDDESVWVRCSMCDARHLGARGPYGRGAYPFPHLVSCPWVRATHIVGVKTDG